MLCGEPNSNVRQRDSFRGKFVSVYEVCRGTEYGNGWWNKWRWKFRRGQRHAKQRPSVCCKRTNLLGGTNSYFQCVVSRISTLLRTGWLHSDRKMSCDSVCLSWWSVDPRVVPSTTRVFEPPVPASVGGCRQSHRGIRAYLVSTQYSSCGVRACVSLTR